MSTRTTTYSSTLTYTVYTTFQTKIFCLTSWLWSRGVHCVCPVTPTLSMVVYCVNRQNPKQPTRLNQHRDEPAFSWLYIVNVLKGKPFILCRSSFGLVTGKINSLTFSVFIYWHYFYDHIEVVFLCKYRYSYWKCIIKVFALPHYSALSGHLCHCSWTRNRAIRLSSE